MKALMLPLNSGKEPPPENRDLTRSLFPKSGTGIIEPGFNSRRLHHTKLRLIRRVRSNRGGVVLCYQWAWISVCAAPRLKYARGYFTTSSEI